MALPKRNKLPGVLSIGLLLTMGGCSSERDESATEPAVRRSPTPEAKTVSPSNEAPPKSAKQQTEPAPGTMTAPLDEGSSIPATTELQTVESAPASTTSMTNALQVPMPSPTPPAAAEITPHPSQFPEVMNQTVELRNELNRVPPGAGGVSAEMSKRLTDYATQVRTLAESAPEQLTKDQRATIEEYAGKLEYQASQIIEGQAQAPFPNRLRSVQAALQQIQENLAQPQP